MRGSSWVTTKLGMRAACLPNGTLVTMGGISAGPDYSFFLTVRAFDSLNNLLGHVERPLKQDIALSDPTIAALNTDTVAIVWHDCSDAPQHCDVFAQRLLLSADPECTGDCDANGSVKINELVVGVNIALSEQDIWVCPVFDTNSDCRARTCCCGPARAGRLPMSARGFLVSISSAWGTPQPRSTIQVGFCPNINGDPPVCF